MSTISAIILTKNEENEIVDCVESVDWCDEVIVIDDNSTDNTQALLKHLNVNVLTRSLNNDFSEQRNYGIEQVKSEWILFIDADERVPDSLRYEIQSVIHEKEPADGYLISRHDNMWGKELKYGEVGNTKLLRLAKKEKGKWVGYVHETWKVAGKVDTLKNAIEHFPHQTVSEFLQEVNFYSTIRARELFDKKENSYWFSIIIYPKAKFFLNYILRMGFRDGIPGLIVALMMTFHSFLVRGKLWQLWHQK